MLNETYTLTADGPNRCRVDWTAPNADDVSMVFVNGAAVAGPFAPGTAARSCTFALAVDEVASLDIHDLTEGELMERSIFAAPNKRPTLRWRKVANAVSYRIYHRGQGADEAQAAEVAAQSLDTLALACPLQLSEGWNFFRVEAVDAYGHESTVDAWPYLVFDVPGAPSDISAEIAGGVLTVTVTP